MANLRIVNVRAMLQDVSKPLCCDIHDISVKTAGHAAAEFAINPSYPRLDDINAYIS